MKIGLNLLYLIPGEVGGTETYALSLIHALSKIDKKNIYYIYLNNESNSIDLPLADNFIPVRCKVNASNRFFRFLWEQCILPFQVAYHRLDILHSLGYISPIVLSCASTVTIPDLNYLSIPQVFTPFTRFVQQFFVTLSVKRANQIIAISEFTKSELTNFLTVPENKITVTLLAPKPRQVAQAQEGDNQGRLLSELGIYRPFLLAFSSLAPHKNIERLIEAFTCATTDQNQIWMLVIAGHLPTHGLTSGLLPAQGSQDSKIVATGYLTDAQIPQLFKSADLFAFPSLYEGFGMPALEAMQYGTPVACSNRGALPEVANGAAEFFDPTDVAEIAKVLSDLMGDSNKRDKLRQLGYERVKHFSWEKTAEKTLETYQCIL